MTLATVYGDLQSALRARLLTMTGVPSAIAWEAQEFAPPAAAEWIREKFSPLQAVVRGVGTNAIVEHLGLFILDVFAPANQGVAAINALTGKILSHYPPGHPLVYGSTAGIVVEASRGANYQQNNWLRSTVTIRASARTNG